MTNRKTTKRALLSSVLALILCFAMLLGSTWAWFTDTATTNVNTIKSGILDVTLIKYDETAPVDLRKAEPQKKTGAIITSLEGQSLPFKAKEDVTDILWEPGATFATDGFIVYNEGNLALNFQVAVTGATVTGPVDDSVNKDGSTYNDRPGTANLLDVIEFKIIASEDYAKFENKELTWDALETTVFVNASNQNGQLGAGWTSDAYYVVAHMDENAGNEYQNCKLENIAVTVYATQASHENDIIGNTYDENAKFPATANDVNSVVNALENDTIGTVVLTANVDTDAQIALNGKILDGDGKTITVTANELTDGNNTIPAILATAGTVQNLTVMGAGRGVGTRGALTGDLIVDNYTADGGSYALHVGSGAGYSLTVTNSTLNGWTSFGKGFESVSFTNTTFAKGTTKWNNVRAYSNVTFTNCEFTGTVISVGDSTTDVVITFVDCTYNGNLITADTIATLVENATAISHTATTANFNVENTVTVTATNP